MKIELNKKERTNNDRYKFLLLRRFFISNSNCNNNNFNKEVMMIVYGKTPKEWRKEIGLKSLYYRAEIVIFLIGFILGSVIF